MRFVYTDEQLEFLRGGFKAMRIGELTSAFNTRFGLNKTENQLKSALKNRKITCGRKPGFVKGENIKLFTSDQVDFIKANYKKLTRRELTAELNRVFCLDVKIGQVVSFCKNHKIRSGRDGRFVQGHESWNRDTKGLTSRNKTSFKKGHRPKNWRPIGSERVCSKDGYVLIKVKERCPHTGRPTRYKHKHIVVWEKTNGPVPDGHIIRFIDGDKFNFDLSNLELITLAENAILNQTGYGELPVELRPAMIKVAKISAKIHQRTRR